MAEPRLRVGWRGRRHRGGRSRRWQRRSRERNRAPVSARFRDVLVANEVQCADELGALKLGPQRCELALGGRACALGVAHTSPHRYGALDRRSPPTVVAVPARYSRGRACVLPRARCALKLDSGRACALETVRRNERASTRLHDDRSGDRSGESNAREATARGARDARGARACNREPGNFATSARRRLQHGREVVRADRHELEAAQAMPRHLGLQQVGPRAQRVVRALLVEDGAAQALDRSALCENSGLVRGCRFGRSKMLGVLVAWREPTPPCRGRRERWRAGRHFTPPTTAHVLEQVGGL